jgi:hypothetical protein
MGRGRSRAFLLPPQAVVFMVKSPEILLPHSENKK